MNKLILHFYSGEKVEVLSENGKYYICEGRQFRKNNPQIASVEVVPKEEGKKPVKKKKPAEKKSAG